MIPIFFMDEVVMDQPIPFPKLEKREVVGHSIDQTKHSHRLLSRLNHGFKLNKLGNALSLYV